MRSCCFFWFLGGLLRVLGVFFGFWVGFSVFWRVFGGLWWGLEFWGDSFGGLGWFFCFWVLLGWFWGCLGLVFRFGSWGVRGG